MGKSRATQMKLEEHEKECIEILGEPFTEVHKYLDQFAGRPECGMKYRCKLHHEEGIEFIKEKFGEAAAKAARLHIESDLSQEGWTSAAHFPKNETDYKEIGFF